MNRHLYREQLDTLRQAPRHSSAMTDDASRQKGLALGAIDQAQAAQGDVLQGAVDGRLAGGGFWRGRR